MEFSSLLSTDLGNWDDLCLIWKNDRLSVYNTIYIFPNFTRDIGEKTYR